MFVHKNDELMHRRHELLKILDVTKDKEIIVNSTNELNSIQEQLDNNVHDMLKKTTEVNKKMEEEIRQNKTPKEILKEKRKQYVEIREQYKSLIEDINRNVTLKKELRTEINELSAQIKAGKVEEPKVETKAQEIARTSEPIETIEPETVVEEKTEE